MATYFAAPTPIGAGNGSSWANAGDLQTMIHNIIAAPSQGGDEIWALGNSTVPYSLTSPLSIGGNTAPLSIYGGFDGTELTLCDRDANINSLGYPNFFPNPSILDGGGVNRVIDIQNANILLIDGFVVRNGNTGATGGRGGGGVRVHNSSVIRFENMVFMNNTVMMGRGGGMYMTGTRNIMVKNSIFFNNDATSTPDGGGGLGIESCYFVKFVNLLFNANTGNGAATFIVDSENVEIVNNTFAYNNAPTGSSEVYCLNANVDIYNSIFYPDRLDILLGTPLNTINVDYCLLSNDIRPFATLQNPNGFNPFPPIPPINPNFVRPVFPLSAGGNYHLSNTATLQSPCIDWGGTSIIFPLSTTDLEGNPRIIDKGINTFPPLPITREVDLGVFEVQ